MPVNHTKEFLKSVHNEALFSQLFAQASTSLQFDTWSCRWKLFDCINSFWHDLPKNHFPSSIFRNVEYPNGHEAAAPIYGKILARRSLGTRETSTKTYPTRLLAPFCRGKKILTNKTITCYIGTVSHDFRIIVYTFFSDCFFFLDKIPLECNFL